MHKTIYIKDTKTIKIIFCRIIMQNPSTAENIFCGIHPQKPLEFFCDLCENLKEKPFCAICICEHNNSLHFKGNLHLNNLVLENREKIIKNAEEYKVHNLRILEIKNKLFNWENKHKNYTSEFKQKIKNLTEFINLQEKIGNERNKHISLIFEKLTQNYESDLSKIENDMKIWEKSLSESEKLLKNLAYYEAYKNTQDANKIEEIKIEYENYEKNIESMGNEIVKICEQCEYLNKFINAAEKIENLEKLLNAEQQKVKNLTNEFQLLKGIFNNTYIK